MNILLTVDEAAGLQALRLLLGSPHRICGVLTPRGNRKIRKLASENSLPLPDPSQLCSPDFAGWVRRQDVDILLNVHLLRIIHPDVITAFRVGAFNLHPGPLPAYAGLNTPSWAIYRQEKQFGVTLHWMDPGIDTGPVVYQASLPIRPRDTGLTLGARCAKAGLKLISKLLEELNAPSPVIPAAAQDASKREFFGRGEKPLDGYIDWTCTAKKIDALMRAYTYAPYPSPWGSPKMMAGGKEVEIGSLEILPEPACSEAGRVVRISGETAVIASADRLIKIGRCRVNGCDMPAGSLLQAGELLGTAAPIGDA